MDWSAQLAATLDKAVNAAVDVTVYKETGGALNRTGSIYNPTAPIQSAQARDPMAGLQNLLPLLLLGGAAVLLVWKLAK